MTEASVQIGDVTYRGVAASRTITPADSRATLALAMMEADDLCGPQIDEWSGLKSGWGDYPTSMVGVFLDIAADEGVPVDWFDDGSSSGMTGDPAAMTAVTAGFDATGDWHDPGNGRFAKPGWSTAKASAIRAIRGAFAMTRTRDGDPDGTWLAAAEPVEAIRADVGDIVKVKYLDATYGIVNAVRDGGAARPVKVKWDVFADYLPPTPPEPTPEPSAPSPIDGRVVEALGLTTPPSTVADYAKADVVSLGSADVSGWESFMSARRHRGLVSRRVSRSDQASPPKSVRVTSTGSGFELLWSDLDVDDPAIATTAFVADRGDNDVTLSLADDTTDDVLAAVYWSAAVRSGKVALAHETLKGGKSGTGADWHVTGPTAREWDERLIDALAARSQQIVDTHARDGKMTLRRDGTVFVPDPTGDIMVPVSSIRHAADTGDTVTVTLDRATALDEFGDDAVHDYRTVLDPSVPWADRVEALMAQRDRLMMAEPSDVIEGAFPQMMPNIESHMTKPSNEQPPDVIEALRVVELVENHGAVFATLVDERAAAIAADETRRHEYVAPGYTTPHIPMTAPVDETQRAAVLRAVKRLVKSDRIPDSAALDEVIDAIESGTAVIAYRKRRTGQPVGVNDTRASQWFDAVSLSTPPGYEAEDGTTGHTLTVHLGGDRQVGPVGVRYLGPRDADGRDVEEPFFVDEYAPPGDVEALNVGRRLATLAKHHGLTAPDERPTLAGLALLETFEAAGITTGHDPTMNVHTRRAIRGDGTAVTGSTSREAAAVRIGLRPFPSSWTSQIVDAKHAATFDDVSHTGAAGFNRGIRLEQNGQVIADGAEIIVTGIEDWRDHGVLVHEFAHSFERHIPGLVRAEAWHLASRIRTEDGTATPERPRDTGVINGNTVSVIDDHFKRPYSGRVYKPDGIHRNEMFEVVTTAMELLVDNASLNGEPDERLRNWILGMLTVFKAAP